MAKTIFFSWQADTPNKFGRTFLKEVLEEACVDIVSDTTLDEALRDGISVDSDTQGVAGQPPIAETIFKKIDATAVFVADMTFTGTRIDKRPTPNPNVLIEYGWALKSLTNERVICVMNTAYGEPSNDSLPFDLAHLRWPIRYTLAEDATPVARAEEKKKLSNVLKAALRLSLGAIPAPVIVPPPSFPEASAKDGPARFRGSGEALGFEDDTFVENTKEVFLNSGATMWLRLMPVTNPQKQWPTRKLKEVAMQSTPYLMPLINGAGGYSYLRASDGEGMYRAGGSSTSRPDAIEVDSVAFAFKTGEVWSVESAFLTYYKDRLYATEIEQLFVKGVERYSQFLKELGIDPPYHWKAGLVGVKGRKLGYAAAPGREWVRDGGPICLVDLIEAEGEIAFEQPATTALLPFFTKIFDECGIERPDYLPQ